MAQAIFRDDRAALRQDTEFLARRLPHRQCNSENEREAAEYIEGRFREATVHAALDDFYSIDSYMHLFAAHYLEFVIVALIAIFSAAAAFVYSFAVFVVYLAEFTGYTVLSRFLPQYETQNVIARFLAPKPQRLIVITANYDSPKIFPLRTGMRFVWLLHFLIVVNMFVIVITCGLEAMGAFPQANYPVLRWTAVILLAIAGSAMFTADNRAGPTRGANNNATGTAAILALARRLQRQGLEQTDVLIVATGAKESWLHGMRHLCRDVVADPRKAFFLNLTSLGAGELRYTRREGMLHTFACGGELASIAETLSPLYRARGIIYRGLPTDALIPLTRGLEAMSILAVDKTGAPVRYGSEEDTVDEIDYDLLVRGVDFAEAIIREIDARTPRDDPKPAPEGP